MKTFRIALLLKSRNLNLKYNFELAGLDATLYGKINNLFNEEYISDALDDQFQVSGTDGHQAVNAAVWFGAGRTWTASLKVRF